MQNEVRRVFSHHEIEPIKTKNMSFLKTVFAPKNLLFTALSMAAVFGILGFLGQRDWVTDPVNKAKSLVG